MGARLVGICLEGQYEATQETALTAFDEMEMPQLIELHQNYTGPEAPSH